MRRPDNPIVRLLIALLCLGCLFAADPPPVPDPLGLGERLALIDHLQQAYGLHPAPGATLAELRTQYAAEWGRRQAAPADTIGGDSQAEQTAQADRERRLRARIAARYQVDADPKLDEAGLQRLLRQLDGQRAVRDAAAMAEKTAED